MPFLRAALLALIVASSVNMPAAHAQHASRVALFKTAADDASLVDLATALDPVLLSALNERSNVSVTARPALDLPGMQLAIDCVGETRDCLGAAAKQAEADSLLAPSVQREGEAVVVTFLHFDPAESQPIRSVRRAYTGARIGEQALSGVEPMLAELFGKEEALTPPAQVQPEAAPAEPAAVPVEPEPEPEVKKLPLAAIILGGATVALFGTGIAFGVMSNSTESDARAIHPRNDQQALAAYSKLESASDQGTVANVMYGLGTAALVGTGVLLYWHFKDRGESREPSARLSVAPQLSATGAGLSLTAAWNDNL